MENQQELPHLSPIQKSVTKAHAAGDFDGDSDFYKLNEIALEYGLPVSVVKETLEDCKKNGWHKLFFPESDS